MLVRDLELIRPVAFLQIQQDHAAGPSFIGKPALNSVPFQHNRRFYGPSCRRDRQWHFACVGSGVWHL